MGNKRIDAASKTNQELIKTDPFAEHIQWLAKMVIHPLTDQSVIVGFYYFWRHQNKTFRQYYRRFLPEDRIVMKQRAWICQQYSKRYLGAKLDRWYMNFIVSMDYTALLTDIQISPSSNHFLALFQYLLTWSASLQLMKKLQQPLTVFETNRHIFLSYRFNFQQFPINILKSYLNKDYVKINKIKKVESCRR